MQATTWRLHYHRYDLLLAAEIFHTISTSCFLRSSESDLLRNITGVLGMGILWERKGHMDAFMHDTNKFCIRFSFSVVAFWSISVAFLIDCHFAAWCSTGGSALAFMTHTLGSESSPSYIRLGSMIYSQKDCNYFARSPR